MLKFAAYIRLIPHSRFLRLNESDIHVHFQVVMPLMNAFPFASASEVQVSIASSKIKNFHGMIYSVIMLIPRLLKESFKMNLQRANISMPKSLFTHGRNLLSLNPIKCMISIISQNSKETE